MHDTSGLAYRLLFYFTETELKQKEMTITEN